LGLLREEGVLVVGERVDMMACRWQPEVGEISLSRGS
jgi:hypothetical protein